MISDKNSPARLRDRRLPRAKVISCLVGVCLAFCSAACGSAGAPSSPSPTPGTGSNPAPPPAPGPAPAPTPAPARVVTITASGVTPAEVVTGVGTRVTFVNNDTIPHDIMGGPDPSRPDCHEIDSVGFLTPGQSGQTSPFTTSRACEYHDHFFHSPLFNGRILIQ